MPSFVYIMSSPQCCCWHALSSSRPLSMSAIPSHASSAAFPPMWWTLSAGFRPLSRCQMPTSDRWERRKSRNISEIDADHIGDFFFVSTTREDLHKNFENAHKIFLLRMARLFDVFVVILWPTNVMQQCTKLKSYNDPSEISRWESYKKFWCMPS